MEAMSGNLANWGDSGAGRRCYNQKARFDTLLCFNCKWLLVLLVALNCVFVSQVAFALGPLVVYSKEDASYDDIIYSRSFSSSWGTEGTAVDTNISGALTNHVAVTRPDGREQAVVAWATGSTDVHVTIYNGTNWDNGSGSPYADAKVITGVSSVYAAAYEQNSGQLLIAVGSGTAQMKYYLWDGSSWVIDGSTQSFASLTQTVQLIRMASKPGAGEIALMANDGTNCVGLIWDGSANTWGSEQKLNTDSVSLHYAAAVTYMQTGTYGGRALFVWDETYVDGYYTYHRLNSREWTGASWQSAIELNGDQVPAVYRLEMAADPNSDDILLVFQYSNGAIQAMPYTGGYAYPYSIATGYGNVNYNRPFNAIFESASGHSGHALIVFSDGSQLKSWHIPSISVLSTYTLSTIGSSSTDCYWIELARTADGATIHLVAQDDYSTTTGDYLIAYTWNNTAWTSQGNLTTGLLVYLDSSRGTKPFALTLQPPAPALTQAHYRWRNDDGYELPPSGTVTVDAVRTYSTTGTVKTSSATIAHPVSSGANRLLLVGVTFWPGSSQTVTSVTWNSTEGLTYIKDISYGTSIRTELWGCFPVATGTHNVVVNLSAPTTYLTVGVISFTGVDQSTPYGTPVTATGSSMSASITVASASNEMVLSVAGAGTNNFNFTSITGGTQRWNLSAATSTKGASGTASGAASVTISHGLSNTNGWAIIGLAIKPARATFALAEDSKIGIAKSTPMRLRFLVSNTDGISSGSVQYQLKFQETATCTSGTYTAVPTTATDKWQIVGSTYITDAEATVDSTGLTNPVGYTFVAGQAKDAGNTTGGINLTVSQFTEMEFSLQATASATAGGDYCFKLFYSTGAELNTYTNYAQARVNGTTAIKLLSFSAPGAGDAVRVGWTTAQEFENKGFNLYRATSLSGPYVKLNGGLIPSGSLSSEGRDYEFIDTAVSRGAIYYYRLDDVDVSGTVTPNGPVCVDWDGDGIPDDWEIVYGLNPAVNDANLDSDGDGVANWLEYARGTNPFNRGYRRGRDPRRGGEEKSGVFGRSQQPQRGSERAGDRLR